MSDLNENIHRANFWAPKPGEINYIVKINKNLENYEVSRGSFKVQESHVELNKIYAKVDLNVVSLNKDSTIYGKTALIFVKNDAFC